MLADGTMSYGEEMLGVLLGVDRLVRRSGGESDDGLVVLNMAPGRREEAFRDAEEARARLGELSVRAEQLVEVDRRLYYRQLCDSTVALLDWREGTLPFQQQVSRFLQVSPEAAEDRILDEMRQDMRQMLTEMGYDGDLKDQCAAWEQQNRVPPDEVEGVLEALMAEAWRRTDEEIGIPALSSDGMHVQTVTGMPFNARCNYLERRVELNIDPVLTRPALKHLAVHECYPGHYLQFKLRETWYREGTAAADGLVSIVNSASSCIFEGIGDNGLAVIDWANDPDDRFSALMSRYRSGIGTGAAWRLHALGWPEERVEDWLREQSLIGGQGWVANRMRFIAAPQRAALIWSYWWGEASLAPVWKRVTKEQRRDFYRYLYGRMHSPQSVALFGTAGTMQA